VRPAPGGLHKPSRRHEALPRLQKRAPAPAPVKLIVPTEEAVGELDEVLKDMEAIAEPRPPKAPFASLEPRPPAHGPETGKAPALLPADAPPADEQPADEPRTPPSSPVPAISEDAPPELAAETEEPDLALPARESQSPREPEALPPDADVALEEQGLPPEADERFESALPPEPEESRVQEEQLAMACEPALPPTVASEVSMQAHAWQVAIAGEDEPLLVVAGSMRQALQRVAAHVGRDKMANARAWRLCDAILAPEGDQVPER